MTVTRVLDRARPYCYDCAKHHNISLIDRDYTEVPTLAGRDAWIPGHHATAREIFELMVELVKVFTDRQERCPLVGMVN